jgi:hypothetical protein
VPDFLYQWPLALVGLLLFVILIGGAELVLALVRRHLLPKLGFGERHGDFGAAMINSMMVFYGLIAALIAINVYNAYSEVSHDVSAEAASLGALYRDASAYPEPVRSRLQSEIRDYVRYTIDDAWPQQRRGVTPTRGIGLVDRFQNTLFTFEPTTEGQKIVHAETVRALNEMLVARRVRLDGNRLRLPATMWGILLAGAFVCLFAACFFDVEDARLHALAIGLVAVLVGMVLFMTFAWDRPFVGEFAIGPGAYEIVYDHLMK